MDFMFEDEVDEVGSDVEAYCPKCKADTTHVVISKYEDEIRRVQCNPCGDVHSYRKPRGEAEDDIPEPVAARKRALLKKLTWDEFFAKHHEKDPKPYEFRECYRENQIVTHPKFGKGFISEIVSESKVEVTFADARRILVHNRRDIPGSPLASEDDGLPSVPPPAKATKSKSTPVAPAKAVRSAAPAPKAAAAPAKAATPKAPVKADKSVVEKTSPRDKGGKKPVAKPAAKKPVAKPTAKKPVAKPAAKKPAAKKRR
jgi:pyruvate/2-oxoglutarate dehydrogenase complex dihydrolipoamide acyltransferase (E2) component